MTLSFIEYLENKNFEVEEIVSLQRFFINSGLDSEKIIKKMNAIYKVFMFAGVPELKINLLIFNNPGLLKKSDHELIAISYVWQQTGLLSDIADKKRGLQASKYIKIFLRNSYLNSGIRSKGSPVSYNALTMSDSEFKFDYMGLLNGTIFYPMHETLINLYGKGNSFEEKEEYINSFVSSLSLKWYLDCLKKEKVNSNERKSL